MKWEFTICSGCPQYGIPQFGIPQFMLVVSIFAQTFGLPLLHSHSLSTKNPASLRKSLHLCFSLYMKPRITTLSWPNPFTIIDRHRDYLESIFTAKEDQLQSAPNACPCICNSWDINCFRRTLKWRSFLFFFGRLLKQDVGLGLRFFPSQIYLVMNCIGSLFLNLVSLSFVIWIR